MRISTLNLWNRFGEWDKRRAVLIAQLGELRPDLATFQEAVRTDEYDQVADMQALSTARFVEELVGRRDTHVVIAGDFDATPEAASIRFWTGRPSLDGTSVCYRDAWETRHPGDPGFTFMPGHNPLVSGNWPMDMSRRIDYILVRCGAHGSNPGHLQL